MSPMTLTPIGIKGGIWSASLTGEASGVPQITVTHDTVAVPNVKVSDRGDDGWLVQVPIPAELISEGVQTFVVSDETGQTIGAFSLLAGEGVGHDLRAEVNLLRAELDLLKRAFRRHCNES